MKDFKEISGKCLAVESGLKEESFSTYDSPNGKLMRQISEGRVIQPQP